MLILILLWNSRRKRERKKKEDKKEGKKITHFQGSLPDIIIRTSSFGIHDLLFLSDVP